jgi:hypothetical protein
MPDDDDSHDHLGESTSLEVNELRGALMILMASYKKHSKYDEAVCLKTLIYALKYDKVVEFRKLCLAYLCEIDPKTKKVFDSHVKKEIKVDKAGDGQFLTSLGIKNDFKEEKVPVEKKSKQS